MRSGSAIHQSDAIIVLPAIADGFVTDRRVRTWLARADFEMTSAPQEMLSRVVEAVAQPACRDGMAALRFWGQTGERPTAWVAAADPVHFEAQLDHLRLQCLWPGEWRDEELQQLFEELQAALAGNDDNGFVCLRSCGYFRDNASMPTAVFSPETMDGCNPLDILPAGVAAARFQSLLSEIQMTLHQSVVNQRREDQNQRTINSLWIWGGGVAAEKISRDLPHLFADDAVLRGYWLSSSAETASWPGSLDDCVAQAPHGFVAVTPNQGATADEHAAVLTAYLRDSQRVLKDSDLRGLTLLFRRGPAVRIQPRQIFRVWRREMPNFQSSASA
ncbi:MAG: hypothetical protein GXP15_17640 [Gammaproteobacteria bacterium]|nr:hypothetical protein [Gammaproteobacteria bacterium]